MVLWGFMFRGHLIDGLRRLNPEKSRELAVLVRSHYFQVHFADAVVLFIVNGLILILELSQSVEGVVLLVLGVTLSLTGIICSFMTERQSAVLLCGLLYVLTISLAFAEICFLAVTNAPIDLGNWVLNDLASPWSVFVVSFVLFFILFLFFVPEHPSLVAHVSTIGENQDRS
jgi:hypothetical protein